MVCFRTHLKLLLFGTARHLATQPRNCTTHENHFGREHLRSDHGRHSSRFVTPLDNNGTVALCLLSGHVIDTVNLCWLMLLVLISDNDLRRYPVLTFRSRAQIRCALKSLSSSSCTLPTTRRSTWPACTCACAQEVKA